MIRFACLVPLGACLSTTEPGGREEDDTGTAPQEPTAAPVYTATGPTTIDSFTPSCLTDTTYYAELVTTGRSNGLAILDLWETTAPREVAWNEEHVIETTAQFAGGEISELTLEHTSSVDDVLSQPGNTLFSCEPGGHFDSGDVITFALRIYDEWGALADCIAFGADPELVGSDEYTTIGGPSTRPEELNGCTQL